MAKSEYSKEKLLALIDIFQQETDENHHLDGLALLDLLSQRGIPAERKSLYRDIALLQEKGWDIDHDRDGYYLASGTFELAELKLLADAVQCARFITEKKSYELIGKLETLTSRHHASELQRQLHLVGRSKAANEQIYYNIDALYSAIAKNCEISFHYLQWHSDGQRRRKDKDYRASPYGLCWDSENYYLVAHTPDRGRTHFRVDRMADISLLDSPRQHPEEYRDWNMAQYSKQVFGMFGGEPVMVKLQFPEDLAGSAVDKFGSDIMMIPQNDGTFTLSATVDVSPVFFSWVFSFGGRVKILAPASVVTEYREMCQKVLDS
jgi:predicted DNA-binding transcriptional regulator YafY